MVIEKDRKRESGEVTPTASLIQKDELHYLALMRPREMKDVAVAHGPCKILRKLVWMVI